MKGKKNVNISLPLNRKEFRFLDGLSRKCRKNGCKTLSRTHILHGLIRIAGELGFNDSIKKCEEEFIECLLKSISKYKRIKLRNRPVKKESR
jgi:hypothetical protein